MKKEIYKLIEKERGSFFNKVSDAIFIADTDGKIIDANKAAQKMTGWSLKELRTMHQRDLHPKEANKQFSGSFQKHIKSGGGTISKVSVLTKSGKLLNVNISAGLININGRGYIQGIFNDVTKEHQLAEKLLKQLSDYQVLSDNNSDFIFTLDRNYNILSLNKSAFKLFRGKSKSLIGKSIKSLFPPKISKGYIESLNKVVKTKQVLTEESTMSVNGQTLYIGTTLVPLLDKNGDVYAVFGNVHNLTERRLAERELQESEEKYRSIFDSADDGIFLMVGEKFIDCNSSVIKMFGCHDKKDVVDHTPFDFSPVAQPDGKKSSKKGMAFIKKVLNGQSQRFYWQHQTKTGILFDAEVSLNRVVVGGDVLIQAIVRDITKQKNDEEKIIQNEERYRSVFNASNDIIVLFDKSGHIIDVNSKWQKIIGYSPKVFIGKHFSQLKDIMTPTRLKTMASNFRKVVTGKPVKLDNLILKNSRNQDTTLEPSISIRKMSGKIIGLMVTLKDITIREGIKNELVNQKSKFEAIFDVLPDFVIYKSADDKFLEVNKAFVDWIGLPKSKIIGKRSIDFIKDKKVAKITRKDDLEVIKSGKPKFNIVRQFTSPYNNNSMWGLYSKVPFFDLNGKVIGILTVTSDITKIVESEKELEKINNLNFEKSERLQAVLEHIGDYVFVIDTDYKITMLNKVSYQLLGCKPEEVIGKNYKEVFNFVYEKNHQINDQFIIQAMENGTISELSNHTILVQKNNDAMPVDDSAAPIKDESGNITGCVVVFRDVSRERNIDKIKTEFVSIASHQLRTPLTGIKWFLELLLNQNIGKLNDKQLEFLNQISESNERMISLVADLLSVSKIETGDQKFSIIKSNIDIFPIIKSVIVDNTALAQEKKVKIIVCKSAPAKIIALADAEHIRQVFQNLISNAIKYSNENGIVEIGYKPDKKDVTFFIKDDGIGIPLGQQKRVFEKFFRADNVITKETSGTGLGLYIANAIVKGHGGKIWFKSKLGVGTTFYFSILKK